ncbi:MAG: EH signature domain-containing protein [Gallionella sp.]|jgi:hypothetical protein
MDALEKLQARLRTVNQVALAKLRPGDSLQMQNERSLLQAKVKGSYRLDEMPLATIEGTLRAYQQNKYLKGLRQIRLVCYGCTQAIGFDAWRLIENREYFEKLLDYVDHYSERRRTFRKLYRALLNGYFAYDPESAEAGLTGRNNWESLRQFLAKHLGTFVIVEFTPDWLATLISCPDLLGEHPDQSVKQGDWSALGEICKRLELDAGSWLVRRLVMAQVMAAQRMDDATFKEELDSLLLLLHDYPLYSAVGLKVLLDRYVGCEDRVVHPQLRDFAVSLWGNPWLPDSMHQWQCGEPARLMLVHWLRRQLLGGFFSLLSNDDKKNPRRLNFWDLYCEDLSGVYFALGRDAYVAGNMALYKFRSSAKGLIAKLTEEKHNVHTCIMQFTHHHVVEFNRENNVAYFYDTREGTPAFYFSKGWVDVGAIRVNDIAEGVDIARISKPLRHQDSRELTWEGKFAHEMGMTGNSVRAFCRKYRCVYEDTRKKDGCQWVRPANVDQYGSQVWSVLAGWGFHFSPEDKAYFHLTR